MTGSAWLSVLSGLGVAGANGANDNAKGVATLVGARILSPRQALRFGHLATFVGAIASIWVSRALIRTFQGGGFLPDELAGRPELLCVIGAAATLTIALATLLRLPVSTTHALTGALAGISIAVVGSLPLEPLLATFVIPLAVSPLISAIVAGLLYVLGQGGAARLGWGASSCLCVQAEPTAISGSSHEGGAAVANAGARISLAAGCVEDCRIHGHTYAGVTLAGALNGLHAISAGTVSAARGLNDAPKLAALSVGLAGWLTAGPALASVAVAMFVGGWLGARRILPTMSQRITDMNTGSAAAANLVASALVILASFVALPVSTTHVTCGALFGIGVVQRQARWGAIRNILGAWVVTLPLAALLAGGLTRAFTDLANRL